MSTSIGHCINLICNNVEQFFDLVSIVLRIPFNGNMNVATVLTDFCTAIASISSSFNKLIFNMLFREMMELAVPDHPVETGKEMGECSFARSSVDEATRNKLLQLIHSTIQSILRVSPLSGQVCLSCYKENYPFITRENYLHKHAVSQLLHLLSYAPVLRERGLTLLVEKLIAIDVLPVGSAHSKVEIIVDDNDEESSGDPQPEVITVFIGDF